MKRKISVLPICILIFFAACNEEKVAKIHVEIVATQDSLVNTMVKRFNLPFPVDLMLDSNSLIFYGNRTFDTSFLLQLKKDKDLMRGTYYEALPEYHLNLNDVKTAEHQILFFEGYSFILDLKNWPIIEDKLKGIPPTDTSRMNNPSVLDGFKYGLCYNFTIRRSNPVNCDKYETFYRFIKDTLLRDIIQQRIPTRHKK